MGEGHELNDGDTYVCFRDGALLHSVRGGGVTRARAAQPRRCCHDGVQGNSCEQLSRA